MRQIQHFIQNYHPNSFYWFLFSIEDIFITAHVYVGKFEETGSNIILFEYIQQKEGDTQCQVLTMAKKRIKRLGGKL
jgi:hypothetical protein